MADITMPGMLLSGDHASRPLATAVGGGTLYACSDHSLIYQSDESAWSTWATLSPGSASLDSLSDVVVATPAAGEALIYDGAGWENAPRHASLNLIVDGGGAAIATGIVGDIMVDFACEIEAVTLLADQSGSIVIDIWEDVYANFPPVDADSITAAAPPTISSATKSQDTTLTGWSKSLVAGSILRFNVDSATTIEKVTLSLKVRRTA